MTCDVFIAGALHLDVIVNAARLPRLDETLIGQSVVYAFGGKGGNQAVAAARFGARVAMAGRVGQDGFATQILAKLDRAGIDRNQIRAQPGASGMSVAIVDTQGEYGAVVVSAANLDIDPAEITIPDGTGLICLQNEIPQPVNLSIARAAQARGIPVLLNAAPARALDPDMAALVSILAVNRIEAADLTGQCDARTAARILRATGIDTVIVTLGEKGVFIADKIGETRLPAHKVDVISTHGAGDAFVGGLAAALPQGSSIRDAIAFAQAAAALHVSTTVDQRASVTAAQVRAFAGR